LTLVQVTHHAKNVAAVVLLTSLAVIAVSMAADTWRAWRAPQALSFAEQTSEYRTLVDRCAASIPSGGAVDWTIAPCRDLPPGAGAHVYLRALDRDTTLPAR
jgi:hypothetical protein